MVIDREDAVVQYTPLQKVVVSALRVESKKDSMDI
jgi:hypothetical protein